MNKENLFKILIFTSILFLCFLFINFIIINKDNHSKRSQKTELENSLETLSSRYSELRNYVSISQKGPYQRIIINKNIPMDSNPTLEADSNIFIEDLSRILHNYETGKEKGNKNLSVENIRNEIEIQIKKLTTYEKTSIDSYFINIFTNNRTNEIVISFNVLPSNTNHNIILLTLNGVFFLFSIIIVLNFFSIIKMFIMMKFKYIHETSELINSVIIQILYIIFSLLNIISLKHQDTVYGIFYNYSFEISYYFSLLVGILYLSNSLFKSISYDMLKSKKNKYKWFQILSIIKNKCLEFFSKIKNKWLIDYFILAIKNELICGKPNNRKYRNKHVKINNDSIFYNKHGKYYLFRNDSNEVFYIYRDDLIYLNKIRLKNQNHTSNVFLSISVALITTILFQYTDLNAIFYNALSSLGFIFPYIILSGVVIILVIILLSSLAAALFSSQDSIAYEVILEKLISEASIN